MKRTVRHVMTKDVVVARPGMSFKQLVRLMETHRVSALPVVGDDGVVLGIVSEADLLLKEEHPAPEHLGVFAGRRRRIEQSKAVGMVASQLMTAPAVTIGPDASLGEAARAMHRHGVKRLPVVDAAGRVAGIVSRADLLSVFLRSDDDIRRDVLADVVDRSLWMEPATIGVRVRDGVVTLQGRLERKSLADAAVSLTSLVDGVVAVDDQLTFEVDDRSLRPEAAVPWGLLPYGLRD